MSSSRSGIHRLRRAVTLVSTISVASLVLLGIAGSSGRVAHGIAQGAAGMRISSSADNARAKIHPLLRQEITDTPSAEVSINIYARAGTDVSRYMKYGVSRAFTDPLGNTFITGVAKGSSVLKLAGLDGVLVVEPLTVPNTLNDDPASSTAGYSTPGAATLGSMRAILQSGASGAPGDAAPETPTGWFDVLDNHQSAAAWAKGYTGAGVTVLVNDSGIDFAHPDLYGMWATVDDPSSPYYGWPMMFDQTSIYMLALDQLAGTNYVASGQAQYADTSTVITEAAPTYQPIDATEAHTYVLPGTSQSGEYHIGTHSDNSLRAWYRLAHGLDLEDPEIADERPAVLLVDEHTAGVYDTVYVDLNFNDDFTDDNPASKEQPVIAADWWGPIDVSTGEMDPDPDGLNDESGGLVYFIADGVTPVPMTDWAYGLTAPANGSLVAFSFLDSTGGAGNHGQLCASNVAAQGVIDGDSFASTSLYVSTDGNVIPGWRPSFKPADAGGMVQGGGRDVRLISDGSFYDTFSLNDWVFYATLGYDGVPGTGDEVQISSNSWGQSEINNDGWDFRSRYIDYLNRNLSPTTLFLFSAGNGAPGFGTVTQPAPTSALKIGASTEYGSTNWDMPGGIDQITYGDVASFSARGPDALGGQGIEILADGSRGSGDSTLNEAFSGANAWETWGGTSRSTPVVAGNAALMYQAYLEHYGTWPDFDTAKTILMSSARDIHYDPFLMGAGMVNGNRAVDVASGAAGFSVSPYAWHAGDYRGQNWPGFANIVVPGGSSETWLTVTNPTDNWLYLTAGDRWLQKMDNSWNTEWTSSPVSDEDITVGETDATGTLYNPHMPNYLWNVTDLIPDGTDIMVFHNEYSYDQFDPTGGYQYEQVNDWQLLVYNWTDNNGDGNAWEDTNGDGTVQPEEYDQGELVRFGYAQAYGPSDNFAVQQPLERSHDGVFIGLQHRGARADVPQTTMNLGLDFYDQVDFPWVEIGSELAVAPHDDARIKASVHVPGDAPAGIYEGSIWFNDGGWNTTVPVTINVAGRGYNMTAGANVGDSWYDNSRVYGSQDWTWRPEAGDWRFYFTDLGDNPAGLNRLNGTEYWMAQVDWGNLPTDLNLYMFSPSVDDFSAEDPGYYGPYTLEQIGGSDSGYIQDGVFLTQTSSGDSFEFVGAPYIPGLNVIALHNVNYDGLAPSEGFSIRAGVLSVSDGEINVSRSSGSGSYSLTEDIVSTMDLSGLVVDGFGLSKPSVETGLTIQQDDPNDPFTASYTEEVHLEHAGKLDVAIDGLDGDDLDLYMAYDFNGDGEFTADELFAASATGSPDEGISVTLPPDGDYLILVHGWSVPAGSSTFDLAVNAVQGDSISVASAPEGGLQAGQHYSLKLSMDAAGYEPGTYSGLVTLGPPEGPAAILIPVTFEVTE